MLVAALVILISPGLAAADRNESNNGGNEHVSSSGTSVRVEISLDSSGKLVARGDTTSTDPKFSECEFHLVEIPTAYEAFELIGEAPSLDAVPYWLKCGTATVDAFWLSPRDLVDYDSIAWAEADRYVREVLAPALTIGVSPNGYAITGVPTWFWLDGWDGDPLNTVVSAPFGATVDVWLRLVDVEWNFGDGTSSERADLGRAYPAESNVQHNFEHRSTSKVDPERAFQVVATVTIAPSYRLNGGGEINLNPNLTATVSVPLVVRQLQAVLMRS